MSLYEQVGIQEYIIVNPHWKSTDELEFFGYELVNGSYQPMQKDSQGRLYSATTDTYLFFEEGDGDEIIAHIIDGITGEELFDNKGSHRARLEAEERADEEIVKRQAAEEQAQAATEQADAETLRRQAAEARAKEAEERIAAALAEIERLRASNDQDSEHNSKK